MAKKRRFDFTKKNKRSGKVENVGYLDLEQDEEQSRCSLYFYGDIVSATWESMWYEEDRCPQDIADFLNQLDGYEDIDIYFNSGGGDVFAGLAIYNQLKRYDGHKVGYVDGMAASIASVIMFACDELHFATGAQAMIHKPLCMAYGNADDFKAVIKQLNLCEDSILDVYMEHVQEGVTRDKIQSLMSNETSVRCLSVTAPISYYHSFDVFFSFRLRDVLEYWFHAFHKFCFFKVATHV